MEIHRIEMVQRYDKKYTGKYMFIYKDDCSEGEWGEYIEGKRSGIITIWNKDIGLIKATCKNDYFEGTVELRYKSRTIERVRYKQGIREGKSFFMWPNGGWEVRTYINGLKNDKAVRHFASGKIEELDYINGIAHGKSIYVFNNNNCLERNYYNGEIIGDQILIFENGKRHIIKAKNKDEILNVSNIGDEILKYITGIQKRQSIYYFEMENNLKKMEEMIEKINKKTESNFEDLNKKLEEIMFLLKSKQENLNREE